MQFDDDADDLLGRVGKGDRDAFTALYDRLAPQVYGLARRVIRDDAQAEEVAQEVFVEAWRTAGRYDPARGSARTWLLTLAHRRAVDRVRASQARADLERKVAAREVDVPFDSVAEIATARVEHQRLRRCLDRLTELQREAITLAYYAGWTYREVAERLGVALPTIKTRMRDGLIRLRDCLEVST